MIDDSKLLTVADMATIFRAPTIAAFRERLKRDRLKPPELRLIPEPINRKQGRGEVLYWSPADVAALLRGEEPKRKRG